MNRRGVVTVALALAGSVAVAAATVAAVRPAPAARVRTVVLVMRHSAFVPSYVEVQSGETVRFVVRNDDPIDHELIVGDLAAQDRHELGTEPSHGERPGEVSAPAEAEVATTVTFGRPGVLLYGCHLPGHWDYGMRGEIRVR